jgi:hypothetical protein
MRVSKDEYDTLVKKKKCNRHSNQDDCLISQYQVQDMFRTLDGRVVMFEDASLFDGNVHDWYVHMARGVRHGGTWTPKGMNSMEHCFNLKYLRRSWMKVPFFHGNDRMAYALKMAAEMKQQSSLQDMASNSTMKDPSVQRLTYLHEMMLLYGFSNVYDSRVVSKSHFTLSVRTALLEKLLEIREIMASRTTNISFLTSRKKNAKKFPDQPAVLFKRSNYLVPTFKQLVKNKLGGAFLARELGLSIIPTKGGCMIAGFHPIPLETDQRDGSPKKGRRIAQHIHYWQRLLPPDDDEIL